MASGDAGRLPALIELVIVCDTPDRCWTNRSRVEVEVAEYGKLDNGELILLANDRGWSSTLRWNQIPASQLERSIVESTRHCLLPDSDDDTDERDWPRVQDALRRHGHVLSLEQLRELPQPIEFGPGLSRHIQQALSS